MVYVRNRRFVEISYNPESSPDYSPTLIVGVGLGMSETHAAREAVPLWFVIPAEDDAARYPAWTFKDETQLAEVLLRLEVVVERHAKPMLEDDGSLQRAVAAFRGKAVKA
jgi:hypothetical protein